MDELDPDRVPLPIGPRCDIIEHAQDPAVVELADLGPAAPGLAVGCQRGHGLVRGQVDHRVPFEGMTVRGGRAEVVGVVM